MFLMPTATLAGFFAFHAATASECLKAVSVPTVCFSASARHAHRRVTQVYLGCLFCATCNLDQVIPELRLDRAMDRIYLSIEHDVIELLNHLARAELTQISSLFT